MPGEYRAAIAASARSDNSWRDGSTTRRGRAEGETHTTICLRPSRGLRMNLRVRSVTGESESAILAVGWRSGVAMLPRLDTERLRSGIFLLLVVFAGRCSWGVGLKKFRPRFGVIGRKP